MSYWRKGVAKWQVHILRKRGYLLLQRVFPVSAVQCLQAEMTRFFDHFEANQESASAIERDLYGVYGNLSIDTMAAAGFPLAPLFPTIGASQLARVVAEHFGSAVCVPRNHVLARRYRAPYPTATPLHRDITVIDPRASVTSWIPLVDCGRTAPGLEVFEGERGVAPAFRQGDAILFLNTTPHRSHVTQDMTGTRQSIELRYMPQALATAADAGNLVEVHQSSCPRRSIQPVVASVVIATPPTVVEATTCT